MKSYTTRLLFVALVTVLAGNVWRVQGQIVGADCASRGPDVCRECCAEKFQLGTIQSDRTCTTPECSPLESALTAPAPEPAAAEPIKPEVRANPVVVPPSPEAVKPAEVAAPTIESAIADTAADLSNEVDTIVEAVVDNASQVRDAGVVASMGGALASVVVAMLAL